MKVLDRKQKTKYATYANVKASPALEVQVPIASSHFCAQVGGRSPCSKTKQSLSYTGVYLLVLSLHFLRVLTSCSRPCSSCLRWRTKDKQERAGGRWPRLCWRHWPIGSSIGRRGGTGRTTFRPEVCRADCYALRTIPPNHSSSATRLAFPNGQTWSRLACTTQVSEESQEMESSTWVNLLIVEGKDQGFYQSCDLFFANHHRQTLALDLRP